MNGPDSREAQVVCHERGVEAREGLVRQDGKLPARPFRIRGVMYLMRKYMVSIHTQPTFPVSPGHVHNCYMVALPLFPR